jgi:hypothetical protein
MTYTRDYIRSAVKWKMRRHEHYEPDAEPKSLAAAKIERNFYAPLDET